MSTRKEEVNFGKSEQFSLTMIPGKFATGLRTNKLFQIIRFLVINVKMLIVVRKSH